MKYEIETMQNQPKNAFCGQMVALSIGFVKVKVEERQAKGGAVWKLLSVMRMKRNVHGSSNI